MITRLFGSRSRAAQPAQTAIVPAGARIYAIGDVHGRADLLRTLQAMIAEDAADVPASRKCIVYLGDYVDRGLHSREVLDLLLEGPPPGFEAVHLKGNHEDLMLRFLEDPKVGPGWIMNGGNATLYSYGVNAAGSLTDIHRLEALRDLLAEKLPPTHLGFLQGLKRWHVEGDFLFVHAGIMPGVPLEAQKDEDIFWIREVFLFNTGDHGKVVVHGHSITETPDVRPNRIGVDTGAYATGVLTGLALEGNDYRFLQTAGPRA